MLDYILFPLIAVFLSLATVNKVFRGTKKNWIAGLSGLFSFCFVMWMAGLFAYGLTLAAMFTVLLISPSFFQGGGRGVVSFSDSIAVKKNPQP